MAREAGKIHPVDIHVGGRVRLRRKLLGMSQEEVAAYVGLTFQQLQKYEKGANRISASKLYDIGKYLKVPVSYFFLEYTDDEMVAEGEFKAEEAVGTFLRTKEGVELAETFPMISKPKVRRNVLSLVRALSGAEEDVADAAE